MKLDKERAVPINEQNLLFGSKETLPGYSSIVEGEAFNLSPISHRRNLLALRNAMIEQTQLYAIAGDVITYGTVILVEKAEAVPVESEPAVAEINSLLDATNNKR